MYLPPNNNTMDDTPNFPLREDLAEGRRRPLFYFFHTRRYYAPNPRYNITQLTFHTRNEIHERPNAREFRQKVFLKVSEIIVVNHWFDDLILNLFLWGTPLAFTSLLCNRSLWR